MTLGCIITSRATRPLWRKCSPNQRHRSLDAAQEPLADFAAALVGQFMLHADDEAWLPLVTAAACAHDRASTVFSIAYSPQR